jgi:hypothetical protein
MACSASALSLRRQPDQIGENDSTHSATTSNPPKRQKAVTPALARVHVPHDPRLAHAPKCAKGLCEHVVVDLWAEVADKDVVVVLGVLLVLLTLVGPVHPDIRVKYLPPVEGGHGLLGRAHLGVLDETIVEPAVLEIAVLDDLGGDDRTGDGKDLGEHVVGDPGGEVADVEMGLFRRLGVLARGDAKVGLERRCFHGDLCEMGWE